MTRTVRGHVGALVALGVLAAVLVTSLVGAVFAAPAQAAAYRYWTYWQGADGGWRFATAGPASAIPADGAVEGWAFRVSGAAGDPDADPSVAPDFEAVCGTTPAEPERKRVALIIDSGTTAIAPSGQEPPAPVATCVVAEPDATGYDLLRSLADVRVEGGLVCGIAGYPTGECAPVLDDADVAALPSPSLAATADPDSTASPTAPAAATEADASGAGSPIATILVALVLVGLVAWLWRRQRTRSTS